MASQTRGSLSATQLLHHAKFDTISVVSDVADSGPEVTRTMSRLHRRRVRWAPVTSRQQPCSLAEGAYTVQPLRLEDCIGCVVLNDISAPVFVVVEHIDGRLARVSGFTYKSMASD